MRRFRNRAIFGAITLTLIAGAALSQERPESILPPGFNETQPAPPPVVERGVPRPAPVSPQTGGAPSGDLQAAEDDEAEAGLIGNEFADEAAGTPPPPDPVAIAEYELPSYARRSLAQVGIINAREGGVPATGFGNTSGRLLHTLMGRLDAPLPSRWLSIALRRVLASRLDTPRDVNGADFAAERAWLLVRMGEGQVARAVVQSVDSDNYTPKLREAALQSALATGDPALLCPVVDQALAGPHDRAWVLIDAICASLSGIAGQGGPQINAARRAGAARGIDLLLAEKAVGTGTKRRAVTIEWDSVAQLTAWRFGLATATATEIPEALFAGVSPRVLSWRAQAGALEAAGRVPAAEMAAAQGVFSSTALIDLYGEVDEGDAAATEAAGIARDLRTAYIELDRAARLVALRQIWGEARGTRRDYARLILTSHAAAALPPASDADTDRLIAAMLSAGLDRAALRWRTVAAGGSDGWAMLMLADRFGAGRLGAGDVRGYRGGNVGDTRLKQQMFFASMAGLGRLDPATLATLAAELEVDVALDNGWTRALDRAAARGEPATVVLLSAVGMQTANWHGVSAAALYRMIAAMHRVGLDGEARMIAVEALTRL